jgi:hypothetical protein
MLGLGFGTPDRQFFQRNYSQFITTENRVDTVTLPTDYEPKALDIGTFGFDFCSVNTESLGCIHSAEQLEKLWQDLVKQGLPLSNMSQAFIVYDICLMRMNRLPAVPAWASLPQLVDFIGAIECGRPVPGLNKRIKQTIDNFRGILRRGIRFDNQDDFFRQVIELSKAVDSWLAETRVLWFLIKKGHDLSLPTKGNDFTLGDTGIKIEVKARLEHMPREMYSLQEQQNEAYSGSTFNSTGLLMTIGLLVSDEVKEAFDRQQAQILVVDISHSFCGWLLPAISQFGKVPLDFGMALDEAISQAKNGISSVVVYCHSIGTIGRFFALAMNKNDVNLFVSAGQETLRTVEKKVTSRQILELLSTLENDKK